MSVRLSEYQFTFLHGVRVRSGTNYSSKLMSYHPDVQLIPPGKTTDEFPLLASLDAWNTAFKDFSFRFNGDPSTFRFDAYLSHFGDSWLRYLVERFELQPGHVFVKDPHVAHIDRFFEVFPRCKLMLWMRDGRDNVASSVRASNAVRKGTSLRTRVKNEINHRTRRMFLVHTLEWKRNARQLLDFYDQVKATQFSEQVLWLRYEEVFGDPATGVRRMLEFMGLDATAEIVDAATNADVVGSSFYGSNQTEDGVKPTWKPVTPTAAFQPVGRWRKWSPPEKMMFKRLAGRELIDLGYESDSGW